MQNLILVVSLILMAAVALFFWRAIRAVNAETDAQNVDKRRTTFIWVLIVFGVAVTVFSLREWPHAIAAGNDVIKVNATSGQWFWEIDRTEVPAGKPIVFLLHTKDVNHGFGVADESGRILFQTQAMPGYVNKVAYVFESPGTYRVMCLEFCGVGHHDMNDSFKVVAQ
jgi:cytochrome c oxidase subunit 2